MHPSNTIKAKHEAKEDNRFQEYAIGNVAIAKDNVHVDDMDKGCTLRVRFALKSTVLV